MTTTTTNASDFGAFIRATRKAQGLRQDEVGIRFIVDLEAGKPTAQLGKALQVLQALGCHIELKPGDAGR